MIANEPRCKPPPSPVILFNLDVPPAFILASRRSRRMRACSEALEGGVPPGDDVVGGVSAIFKRWPSVVRLRYCVNFLNSTGGRKLG